MYYGHSNCTMYLSSKKPFWEELRISVCIVGNPSIATLVTHVVFFSYLYSSRYTLRIASILAYIFFQNHNPKDHPWFCVARLHG